MTEKEAVSQIVSLVSILGLAWLIFWQYPKYRTYYFRNEIFRLRDELFLEAAKGLIPFSHPAYVLLRSTMNGYIRFGHKLNFSQFVIAIISNKKGINNSFEKKWNNSINGLDDKTKARLKDYLLKMNILALKHIYFNSPASFILIAFVILIILVKEAGFSIRSFSSKLPNYSNYTAMLYGN